MSKLQIKPKKFYIERILSHEKSDEVIRGTGWDGKRGCSIGCTLNNYSHEAYEKAGIGPEWLARVQDTLFEGMSEKKSHTWTSKITKAIPDRLHGKVDDPAWKKIKAQFLIVVLKSALDSFDHLKFPDVKNAIDLSIKLWEREDIGSRSFNAAADAARAAADAAYAGAYAGAYAARAGAYAAAYAARAAADAAYAGAYAAAYAARAAADAGAYAAAYAAYAGAYAARAKKYDFLADEMLRILKEYK